jgi:exopolysaccharide production protein ExoY
MSSDFPNLTATQRDFAVVPAPAGILPSFPAADPSLLASSANGVSFPDAVAMPDDACAAQDAWALLPARPVGPIGGGGKRLMDIAVASVALCLAAPVMLVVAASTLAAEGGPVIFAHRRIGFSGKPFQCYKFRTMRRDAAEVLERYLADNPEAAREWGERKKLKHDPRVTVLGRILRLSSLDELPQFLNVLRGEMSCIGPRPVVADELRLYGNCAGDYLSARPGITGLWQVSGRNSIGYADRVRLDSHYVRNWSLRGDLMILLRTVFAVLRVDRTS